MILYTGDPRRQSSGAHSADGQTPIDPGEPEDSQPLRRCSASFKLMGFEHQSARSGSDTDGSEMEESDTYDPAASPDVSTNARGGGLRKGARALRLADVKTYRNLSEHHRGNGGEDMNRFAKWANLTDDSELPYTFLRQCAENFDKRLRLLSELVLFTLFLLLFIFFVVADNSVEELYFNGAACTRPARQPIPAADLLYGPTWGPTFEDTHTIVNVSDWLERVVVPAYWKRPSSTAVPDVYRLMLGNNVPLGGLVIRVQRRRSVTAAVSCGTEAGDTTCTVSVGENRDTQKVGRSTAIETDGWGTALPFRSRYSFISNTPAEAGTYDWSGNALVVPFTATQEEALSQVQLLRANQTTGWYGLTDPTIQSISVVSTTFNPTLQYFARTEFLVEVPSSGVGIPSVHYWPFFLFTTEGHRGYAAYTIIFFIYFLLMAVRWIWSIPAAFNRGRLMELLSTVWFFVEAANLIALFVVFVVRFIWWSVSNDVAERIAVGSSFTYSSDSELLETAEKLEYMAALYRLQMELNALNTVLFFLIILKYTSLHPTLERVTIAMRLAQQSIVGLFAVFVAVLLAFAICGNALFGGQLGDFRSIEWSFSSLMRMLLGDSNLPAMQNVNKILAGMFYWAFLILGLFITLNFIMAVIGEALNHSERESAAAFYVPLKQQYLMFMDNLMMQLRRLKVAFRLIRHHQRKKARADAAALAAGASPTPMEPTGSTVMIPSRWTVVKQHLASWGVYVTDALRAMLVGATAVASYDCRGDDDENEQGSASIYSFFTNTRYTTIAAALDDCTRRLEARRRAAVGADSSMGAAEDLQESMENPSSTHDGPQQLRKTMHFVEFALIVEGFMHTRRKIRQAYRQRRFNKSTKEGEGTELTTNVTEPANDDTAKVKEEGNDEIGRSEPIDDDNMHEPTADHDELRPQASSTGPQREQPPPKKRTIDLEDKIEREILETDFVKILYDFWLDAAHQHRMYQRSHEARERGEVQHAAWEASTRAIENILEEVLRGDADCYPVLQAAAAASRSVMEQLNRTVRAVASTGASVERLTRTLSTVASPNEPCSVDEPSPPLLAPPPSAVSRRQRH